MDYPFPNESTTPTHIRSLSRFSGIWNIGAFGNLGGITSLTWLSANRAVYVPMQLPFPYVVRRVWWQNGSSVTTTNNDFGIYAADGTRIYSTGSTAQSGASLIQYVSVSTPFVLPPGQYFFAIAISSTTANRGGTGSVTGTLTRLRQAGFMQQDSALPLPAIATFAAITGTQPIPQMGITRYASGF